MVNGFKAYGTTCGKAVSGRIECLESGGEDAAIIIVIYKGMCGISIRFNRRVFIYAVIVLDTRRFRYTDGTVAS
jgi:hypothetical protein